MHWRALLILLMITTFVILGSVNPYLGRCSTITRHRNVVLRSNCSNIISWLERVATQSNQSYVVDYALVSQLDLYQCRTAPATLDEILFVVMCSTDLQERVQMMNASWLAWVPHKFFVSDGVIPCLNVTILPKRRILVNKTNYQNANIRHVKSLQ